jgi:hypothetical protein
MAVIAVTPLPTAVAIPVAESIVPTEGILELHVAALIVDPLMVADWFVKFTVLPDPVVPIAMYWALCLAEVAVCVFGTMVSETSGSADPEIATLNAAVPVTTVPSGLEAMAVIAVAPLVRAVATPVLALMEATDGTLEVQVAALIVDPLSIADWFVRFTVAPEAATPIAMNCAV